MIRCKRIAEVKALETVRKIKLLILDKYGSLKDPLFVYTE